MTWIDICPVEATSKGKEDILCLLWMYAAQIVFPSRRNMHERYTVGIWVGLREAAWSLDLIPNNLVLHDYEIDNEHLW